MRKHVVMLSALVAAFSSFAAPFTDGGVTYTPNDEVSRYQPVVTGVNVTGMVESVSYTKAEVDRRIVTNAPVRSVNGMRGNVRLGAREVGALPDNRAYLEDDANFVNAVRNVQIKCDGRGVETNEVIDIVNATIATNPVVSAKLNSPTVLPTNVVSASGKAADAMLTGAELANRYTKTDVDEKIDDKRDKTDISVYDVTRTENTDWTWESENAELAAALNESGVKPQWVDLPDYKYWDFTGTLPSGWYPELDYSSPHSSTTVVFSFNNLSLEVLGVATTATRPRYMDETLGPAKQNQRLAAVATGDAHTPSGGDLVKYDASNDRFVKATASDIPNLPYLKLEGGGSINGWISASGPISASSFTSLDGIYSTGSIVSSVDGNDHILSLKADRATTLSGYGITDGATKEELAAVSADASNAILAVTGAEVVIGRDASIVGASSRRIAIGDGATANRIGTIAIGGSASATSAGAVAVGDGASALPQKSIAVGAGATANAQKSIAVGAGATANAQNAAQIGTGMNSETNSLKFRSAVVIREFGDTGTYQLGDTNVVMSARLLQSALVDANTNTTVDCECIKTNMCNIVHDDIVKTVNAVKYRFYDAGLSVTWTNIIDNGHIYYVTVTNTNVATP